MVSDEYKNLLTINNTDIVDTINARAVLLIPTKTSQVSNNSDFITSQGNAAFASNVTQATSITAASGVQAGGKGPSNNVTINRTSGSIIVPQITVKANGTISAVTNRTFSLTTP